MTVHLPQDDVEAVRRGLERCVQYIAKLKHMLSTEPGRLERTRYHSLATDYSEAARDAYLLGERIDVVREYFAGAAHAWVEVFKRRGTEQAFPVWTLTVSGDSTPVMTPPENQVDHSLTSSRKSFVAMCHALLACEDAIAAELASMVWDPPNARFIARNSSTCTPNDQRLAHALKAMIEGDATLASTYLQRMDPERNDPALKLHARLLAALSDGDNREFLNALESLLAWHQRTAMAEYKFSLRYGQWSVYLANEGLAM